MFPCNGLAFGPLGIKPTPCSPPGHACPFQPPAGEPEPLCTHDVPVMSNPTFDATAHHAVTLPPGQDIAAALASGGGAAG